MNTGNQCSTHCSHITVSPSHKDNTIVTSADNTTVIGLITGGDGTTYRSEVASRVTWCEDNNLTLNKEKTKQTIVDMRKERRTH